MLDTLRTNTILYCRLWNESIQFYKHVLQLDVSFENEWFVELRLNPTTFLSIADSSRATIDDVAGQGITLSWQASDLDAAKEQLDKAGVATSKIQKKWNAQVFYFHDPEGHRIELWHPVERHPVDNSTLIECDLETSVPDWLIDHSSLLPLFQALGIDYCCGGKSLESACQEQALDPEEVLKQIRELLR